jgi:alpha-galactosidase
VRNNAAGQAYYDSLVRLYAGWGVDFIKVDCIASPYRAEQIRMIHLALKKTGRPTVLSLSPGPTSISEAYEVRKYAQMWRISNDLIDSWSPKGLSPGLKGQFSTLAEWAPYEKIGHWPDADMLPLGYLYPPSKPRQTTFTPDEQRTMITLWSIARSPLILGANLTKVDPLMEQLLTNREVIAVSQHSANNQALIHTSQSWVWTARATSAQGEYVALFNVSDSPFNLHYTWQELGLSSGKHAVRDLWLHKDIGRISVVQVMLRPHASIIYRVK